MPDEYSVMIHDRETGAPKAVVNATALHDDGNDIVEAVREAVEPEVDNE